MKEELVETIKSIQLKINTSKAALEFDPKVQSFIELLNDYPEAWDVIFHWKQHPKPLVVVEPAHFDFVKLRSEILSLVSGSHYLREFAYSFFEQYEGFEHENERIKRINEFLKRSMDENIFEPKSEYMLYCSQCGKTILINRLDEKDKCSCGTSYDFKFSLTSVPNQIVEGIISGHLLELYALRVVKMIEGLRLVGMEIGDEKERSVYTSIEYAGIGVGDKANGELDLLGLRTDLLVAIECKFNETTYDDIKDFLGVAENLFFKVRESHPNAKMSKIVFSYDGSKLIPTNAFFVTSLKNISSANHLAKEIRKILQ